MDGDAKAFSRLTLHDGRPVYLITQNRDSLKVFVTDNAQNCDATSIRIKSRDVYALIEQNDGRKRKEEFYYGSGYLSSSSRTVMNGHSIKSIDIFGQGLDED